MAWMPPPTGIHAINKAIRTDVTWSRSDYEWDPGNIQFICSDGEPLKQFHHNYSDPNRGPTAKGVAKYYTLKHTCQVAHDIAKIKRYAISMRLRKKVEILFVHHKRILGLGRLLLRGPCAVQMMNSS